MGGTAADVRLLPPAPPVVRVVAAGRARAPPLAPAVPNVPADEEVARQGSALAELVVIVATEVLFPSE